jgi:hypothetical protein
MEMLSGLTASVENSIAPGVTVPVLVRRFEGSAVQELSGPLREAGLLPAPIPEMDPEFLAQCTDDGMAGLVVGFRERPIGYIAYRRARSPFPLRVGPFVFDGPAIDQVLLMGCRTIAEDEPVVGALLEDLLRNKSWHLLRVFDLPLEDPLARWCMSGQTCEAFWTVNKKLETWELGIDGTFADYLQRRFGAKARYNLRREVRLLEAAAPGQVRLGVYTREEHVDEFLENAQSIAETTYQWRWGLPKIEATPPLRRRLALLARRGLWRSYILYIGSSPAAFCHATIRYGALDYEIVGYDPRFRDVAPGKVLLYRIIEDLFASRAVDRLSFGTGPAQYKRLFATDSSFVVSSGVYGRSRYARLLGLTDVALDQTRDWLSKRFPNGHASLKRWLRARDQADGLKGSQSLRDLPVRERYRRTVEAATRVRS